MASLTASGAYRRPSTTYVAIPQSAQPSPFLNDETTSADLKHRKASWTRRTSTTAAPLVWRTRSGVRAISRMRCVLFVLLPFALLVLIMVAIGHPVATKHVEKVTSWTTTALNRNGVLRSPHSTYAYAVPMPNIRGAYEEHPIHGLMREARANWTAKVERQSKSLDEAVREYRRRFGREPPPGFEKWYRWAREHDVQLIDEFDSTFSQVEPYFSVRPSQLRERVARLEDSEGEGRDHAIVFIENGKLRRSGARWRDPVPEGFEVLLKDIAHMLPDMVVPLYLHDASFTQIDWDAMQEYKNAAREHRWVNETALQLQGETYHTWRERTCAPDSELRRKVAGLENHFLPPGPSFVRFHSREMSYCTNPQNLEIHGATSGHVYLQGLRPSFAMSRTGADGDMLWTPTIQYDLNPENESTFREKKSTLLWRGSPDGIAVDPDQKWRQSHRFRMLTLLNSNDTRTRPLRQTRIDRFGREYQLDVDTTLAELNERYSNVRATGGPVQCRPDLCDHIRTNEIKFVEKDPLEVMADNRYVMDVDGNAYSARFRAHLSSNQVPLKATIYTEWQTPRLQPWLHYVPVRLDYSDVYNILAFFDGGLDAERTGNHDDLAEEIATAGKEWAQKFWRSTDMQAYLFRLLLEYARVMDPERERR
ncbi:uncharacterized protein JCM10292_005732 [Rhodotorula paludigena]|uniref:uncharacterized protein n=1 Tax=Rhodotorula paludigena TaxID=86838 RepID=UPI00317C2492